MPNKNLDMVQVDEFDLRQLELLGMNVNEFTEKKKNLTYLSWSNAWEEFLRVFPQATYSVRKDIDGNAFFGKSHIGYMTFTTVKVMGIEREMWLLVMDGANNALKDEPYDYTTKYGKKHVDAIDMFDINKTIMRCLVKNLAMFGLGLYIYKGEDLPTDSLKIAPKSKEQPMGKVTPSMTKKLSEVKAVEPKGALEPITDKQKARIHILLTESGADKKNIYSFYNVKSCSELSQILADEMIAQLTSMKKQANGKIDATQISQMVVLLKNKGYSKKGLLEKRGIKSLDDMSYKEANEVLAGLRKLGDRQ